MTVFASSWLKVAAATLLSVTSIASMAAMAASEPASWKQVPAFASAIDQAKARHLARFESLPDVPRPVDAGGGYTHEQHKRNAITVYEAGMLFHWTGERAFAEDARDLLLAYAELYPTLSEHPEKKEQSPGRLFWQSLNEAVWLVYVAQGYEAIRDALDAGDRQTIETQLLRTMVRFLSEESPQTFNKIHNHGTWAVAATGITGYVLGDDTMVQRALLGLEQDGKAGFLRQLDELFSPDGYYNEGPYYQRYALMPFVLFARFVDRNDPKRGIFEHRDGILVKAIHTAIQLSYGGLFFPLNDAIKDKGLDTIELDYAIPIAYAKTNDPSYLSLIDDSQQLVLSRDALDYASAQATGAAVPFAFESLHLRDGPQGDRGALSVLRKGDDKTGTALVFKATSHGMGHGHFDRLSWLYYDDGVEVVTDYGAARFLNIVQKNGGHYLRENNSWAKQSVAHNSFVMDEASQFGGDAQTAERSITDQHFFFADDTLQIASAREQAAYPGATVRRTMVAVDDDVTGYPLVLDLFDATSKSPHSIDLPLHYRGQLVATGGTVKTNTDRLLPLGENNGYQHLWDLGKYTVQADATDTLTWLSTRRFYSQTVVASQAFDTHITRIGANDPDLSLRPEPGMIRRFAPTDSLTVAAVLATHGEYNGAREYTLDSSNPVAALTHHRDAGNDLITISLHTEQALCVAVSYDPDVERKHRMTTPQGNVAWQGFAQIVDCPKRASAQLAPAQQDRRALVSYRADSPTTTARPRFLPIGVH
ncbi:MAG: heparinase II/III family protein [Gammaproteobacteria bacterium]